MAKKVKFSGEQKNIEKLKLQYIQYYSENEMRVYVKNSVAQCDYIK